MKDSRIHRRCNNDWKIERARIYLGSMVYTRLSGLSKNSIKGEFKNNYLTISTKREE